MKRSLMLIRLSTSRQFGKNLEAIIGDESGFPSSPAGEEQRHPPATSETRAPPHDVPWRERAAAWGDSAETGAGISAHRRPTSDTIDSYSTPNGKSASAGRTRLD